MREDRPREGIEFSAVVGIADALARRADRRTSPARALDVDPATLMPTGGAGADVVVPEDRLERLHPDDAKDVVKVVRRAREERGGYSGQG